MSDKPESDFSDPLGVCGNSITTEEEDDGDFEFINSNVPPESDSEDDIDKYFENAHTQKSSMANLAYVEPVPEEVKDLLVTVDKPEKHATTLESYITFRIITKTSRSEYDLTDFSVRRRYNDFLWLRERLEVSHPTHLVPPLPQKNSLKRFDRFNADFVRARMNALDKFMKRLADHPVLSCNKCFIIFITATQSEFNSAKKESSGVFKHFMDSFHNISASYMLKTRASEFDDMLEYASTFCDKLERLERISQRVLKEQDDLLQALDEWGPVFTLWSNSESRFSHALQAVANSIKKCYLALEELTTRTEAEFSQPLKEYTLYADVIKNVLRRRDHIQMEYDLTLEELNRKKNIEHIEVDEETLKEEISELSKKVEEQQDKATVADSDLRVDMERWHKLKKKDFKKLFMDLADRQIEYYTKCMNSWEESIPHIQKTEQYYSEGSSAD